MSLHRSLMMRRYGLEHSTFLYSPVVFDPIFTPLFTAILGTGGLTIGATTITYASIASAIATTAISIGAQMLLAPKPPKPEDGRAPLTQAIPYRTWGVGTTRISGAMMLFEAVGSNLFEVQALCGHPISQIRKYYLHDDVIDPDDVAADGSTPEVNGRYGPGRVWIWSRLGANPETAYDDFIDLLETATGNPSQDFWTSAHRGDGQASVALVAQSTSAKDQGGKFPYGPPRISVEADLAKVWDFRDEDQDPEDPSTWVFSKNAALIMCWHQCFNEFGHRRDYTKAILPVLDMWKEEADICDEDVPLNGGGTEKRYECNGFDTAENGPKVATNAILAACDGWICERGDGALLFTVGKFREELVTELTDADIVGHQIQHDVLPEDEINQLVPRFTYPETAYTTSDTDFFEDVGAQVTAGRILRQEADYSWCHQWRQARRLGIRDWRRILQKRRGSIDVRLSGINAIYSRWVRLVTPNRIPSLNGAIVENRRSVLALMRGGFQMDIIKHPDNIDAWNPATDEGAQPPVPDIPESGTIVVPVINVVQAKPSGQSVYIRVVIIDPEDDALMPVVRYRLADNGTGNPGAWVEQEFPDATPGDPVVGYVELNTNVVPSDKELEVEAAFKVTGGQYSDWSVTADVTSTVDPVAPAALTSFTQTAAAPHLGNAVFSIVTPNDSHLKTVKLYRKATGSGVDVDVDTPIATLSVSSLSTYGYTDGDASSANFVTNGDFASSSGWTMGGTVTVSGGTANKAAGAAVDEIFRTVTSIPSSSSVRGKFDISAWTSGNALVRLRNIGAGTNQDGSNKNTVGEHLFSFTLTDARDRVGLRFDAASVMSCDNLTAYVASVSCAPQGTWDYYAVPFNGSNIDGPPTGPVTITVI